MQESDAPYQHYLAVLADTEVINHARLAVRDGVIDAVNDTGPYTAANHRGTRAHQQIYRFLGMRLCGQVGWQWEEITSQMRIISPVGRYDNQVRLVSCSGAYSHGSFKMPKRGERSGELVNLNNQQLELFGFNNQAGEQPPGSAVWNLWLMHSFSSGLLTVYLALPSGFSADFRTLQCEASQVLFQDMLPMNGAAGDVSQSDSYEVDLEENFEDDDDAADAGDIGESSGT